MKKLLLLVGCTKFPNMEDGQIGFATNRKEDCMKTNHPYQNGDVNGFIHIRNHEELTALAIQIGAMTKAEFFYYYNVGIKDPWKNDYIRYLDKYIQRALLETGINLTIDDHEVMFYTKLGNYERTPIKHSNRFLEIYREI